MKERQTESFCQFFCEKSFQTNFETEQGIYKRNSGKTRDVAWVLPDGWTYSLFSVRPKVQFCVPVVLATNKTESSWLA